MTKTEYLEEICKNMGIDVSALPDKLLTTYFSAISEKLGVMKDSGTLGEFLEAFTGNYNVGFQDGKSAGYSEGYSNGTADGVEQGKQAEYDAFWDLYQQNGKRNQYIYSFAGHGWDDSTFKPKYNMRPSYSCVGMFYSARITDLEAKLKECGVTLDLSFNANYTSVFSGSTLTVIPEFTFSDFTATVGTTFSECSMLHTIRKIILKAGFNGDMSSCFKNCTALENVVFEGVIPKGINVQWCPLTHDSLMSIINALKDYSGTDTWMNITLGSDNIAKLSAAELEIMDRKQWNYG